MVQFPWQTSSRVRQLLPNNYAGNVQPQNQPKGWWYSPSFFPLEFQEQNPKERSLQPAPSAAPSFWKHLPASMMMHRTVLLPKKWPALRCPPLPPRPPTVAHTSLREGSCKLHLPSTASVAVSGLELQVFGCVSKHVLQFEGLCKQFSNLLVPPVVRGKVLKQHQNALQADRQNRSKAECQNL